MGVNSKAEGYKMSYNQYSDLERDIRAILYKNNYKDQELDNFIVNMNLRLSLIEDSILPIDYSPSSDTNRL